jgi:hypothetical protein
MKLTERRLRSLIKETLNEVRPGEDPHVADQGLEVMTERVAEAQDALQKLLKAHKEDKPVSAMQAYNRARAAMRDILEVLEGHPENVDY